MDLSKISLIFKYIILGIFYIIIIISLRIMYKDIKGAGRQRKRRYKIGLEILECSNNSNLRKGAVIPVDGQLTIGRKKDNILMLDDVYVSGYHARIYINHGNYVIEDLSSTNGTYVNERKIIKGVSIASGDIIKIGSTVLKVI